MKKILEALEHCMYCIANYREYGESFDYEAFAKEKFKKEGPGFVSIDATELVSGYLKASHKVAEAWAEHQYVGCQEFRGERGSEVTKVLELANSCDFSTEYLVLLSVKKSKLAESEALEMPDRLVYFASRLKMSVSAKPSIISKTQIRKRLKRLVQYGRLGLILDTREPDYMGDNLGKWLREIKELKRQGNHISVIINDEDSSAKIPDEWKENIFTINLDRRKP